MSNYSNEDVIYAIKELGDLCAYTLGVVKGMNETLADKMNYNKLRVYNTANVLSSETSRDIDMHIKKFYDSINGIIGEK